ncbi:MAG: hypothetical protein ACOYMA_20105 [Bacteroidia bacterium]
MKLKQIIFLLTLITTVNIQCSKTPPGSNNTPTIACDSTNTVLIPEDMKARFYFKQGTYWIYKNIDNGEIDSMWVYISNNGIGPISKKVHAFGWNKCYESFSYEMHNKTYSVNNYYINYGISLYPKDGNNLNNELFEIQQLSPLNNYKGSYHIYVEGVNYSNQQGADINYLDSIVNDEKKIFKNVLNIYYPNGTSSDIYSNMYYVKNIGLVKFVRSNDNSTWELIRYKINQ